jgi:hypothetical protein
VSQPYVMASALRRLVGEIHNARAEGLRVHETQRLLIAPALKQTLPAAHDYGMDHEPEFVEEVLFKQRPDQGRAAGYRDVLARLLLEPGDLFGDVVPYEGRVLPLEGLLEGRGDHVLPDAVHSRRPRSTDFRLKSSIPRSTSAPVTSPAVAET